MKLGCYNKQTNKKSLLFLAFNLEKINGVFHSVYEVLIYSLVENDIQSSDDIDKKN